MFGVSGGELIILLLIGLVVLGPERLPRVANQIGGWLGQARRMTRVMKRQLEEELDLNDALSIKSPPPPAREPSTQPEKLASESALPDSPEPEYTLPRDDDDYSPAHDAEDVGTGVGDEIVDTPDDLTLAETGNETVTASSGDASASDANETDGQATGNKSTA